MKDKLTYILSGAVAIVAGIFMILNPESVVNIIASIFALFLVIRGWNSLKGSFRLNSVAKKLELTEKMDDVRKTMLARTLVSFGVGVLVLIISIVSLMEHSDGIMKAGIYVIAIGFFLNGILGMVENQKFRHYGDVMDSFRDRSFINVLIAIVLFVFPFLIGSILITILGGIVILLGVATIAFATRAKVVRMDEVNEVEFTESKEE